MTLLEDKEERFRHLYDRYYGSVVAFLVRFGLSREDARDVAQDVYVRVYESMDSYRGDAEWTFLAVTAKRAALNHIRKVSTQKRKGTNVPLDAMQEPDGKQSPEAAFAEREEREQRQKQLKAAIDQLPHCVRTCLVLWLRGCTYTDIQSILGITMDAVKSRLHDARNRLKKRLAAEPEGLPWPNDHDVQE